MTDIRKKTQNEIYLALVEEQEALNYRAVSIETTINLANEEYKKYLAEIKEEFGVNSIEELREFRSKKDKENEEILKEFKEVNDAQRKEIEIAEEQIKDAKIQLNQ